MRPSTFCGIFLFAMTSLAHAADGDGTWTLGPTTIPAPKGASAELQEAIKQTPEPNPEAARQAAEIGEAEWFAQIAQQDVQAGKQAMALAAQLSVSVAKSEIDGVPVYNLTPKDIDPTHKDHLFIHIHGGAYVLFGGDASISEGAIIAARIKMPVVSVDYRMPPKAPFPAAVDDVVTVYKHLLKDRTPSSIVIGGTSAGAGLSLASVHKFKALSLPLPGAVYAGTPWADLTKTGDTLFSFEGLDRVLVTYDGFLKRAALAYAAGQDLKDPLLSPVYGDFKDFPPTYLITGTRDMFLSDTARTHRKLRQAGVIADLHVYEGVSHADYLRELQSAESRQVFVELAAFLKAHLK